MTLVWEKVRMIDNQKISFIMCVNNERAEEEARYYISKLRVPDGFSTDIIAVKGAKCITEGYNRAMKQSDAKYKIYMHQDVFILYEEFLHEIIRLFNTPGINVGMIGMVGTPHMRESGIMWQSERVGGMFDHKPFETKKTVFDSAPDGSLIMVEAIDGFMMATQYDIPWREDVIKGWDFYDASHSFEFRKRGYDVVVPHQDIPWCMHDDGYLNLECYFMSRKAFLDEYRDMINA